MVKKQISEKDNKSSIPYRQMFFYYKKLKEFLHKNNISENNSLSSKTIYVSKKYPKMDILELYLKLKKYLIKHFQEIKDIISSTKIKKEKEEQEKKNDDDKRGYIYNNQISDIYERVKTINESNLSHRDDYFKTYILNEQNYEKYNNHFVKSINIRKKTNFIRIKNVEFSVIDKNNEQSEVDKTENCNGNKKDDSSTTSLFTTKSLDEKKKFKKKNNKIININKNQTTKIHFVTRFININIPRKKQVLFSTKII